MKNVSNLNVDPAHHMGNGSSVGANPALSTGPFSPRSMNGNVVRRPVTNVSPDFVFPPGGIPSLRLPTVSILAYYLQYGGHILCCHWLPQSGYLMCRLNLYIVS